MAALGWPAWSTENPRGSAKRLRVGGGMFLFTLWLIVGTSRAHPPNFSLGQPSSQEFWRQQHSGLSPPHRKGISMSVSGQQGTRGTDFVSLLARMLDLTL